ncbi:hypothetical protein PPERSA_02115 [Pseudocohnilembus persalinus]|uniref:Copper transport protein n=1 Tax=Pseudocohnilembus persalinus TaxID=266149 RepID=A0A0V0Q7W8_PSEPJ|nr:hypothetical protein PPERSA_02115 [Pseudocohnilembus persalinus]|eukprot:KRW98338.1 hypothetical protein PPERSA_02115 [Pseudocohnilembus persalinus]
MDNYLHQSNTTLLESHVQHTPVEMEMGSGMGHMGHMYMIIWFDCNCEFVFKELKTTECGYFLLGCLLTILYCIFHMGLSNVKHLIISKYQQSLTDEYKSISGEFPMYVRIQLAVWYFVYMYSNFLLMLLMMTMNGYVEIAIAAGLAIGYVYFNLYLKLEQKSKQSIKACNHC